MAPEPEIVGWGAGERAGEDFFLARCERGTGYCLAHGWDVREGRAAAVRREGAEGVSRVAPLRVSTRVHGESSGWVRRGLTCDVRLLPTRAPLGRGGVEMGFDAARRSARTTTSARHICNWDVIFAGTLFATDP